VRWAVRATLALGVAASVTANVLHAQPHPVSQAIAAWPPLALLLAVELISRVPVDGRVLAATRFAATAAIAGIAAWVSYWHMAGVAARYGESGASPYLLPLSVDGLVIVASICLVELGGRITAAQAVTRPAAGDAAPQAGRNTAPRAARDIAHRAASPGAATHKPDKPRADNAPANRPAAAPTGRTGRTGRPRSPAGPRQRRPLAETVAMAATIEASRPDASEADVASALGITPARLRAVRKQARELQDAVGRGRNAPTSRAA
jgi:hypothetical protein